MQTRLQTAKKDVATRQVDIRVIVSDVFWYLFIDGTKKYFGLLIGRQISIIVVFTSHVAAHYQETRRMSLAKAAITFKFNLGYVAIYSASVFPSLDLRIYGLSPKSKATSSKCKFFWKLNDFSKNICNFFHYFLIQFPKMWIKTESWKPRHCWLLEQNPLHVVIISSNSQCLADHCGCWFISVQSLKCTGSFVMSPIVSPLVCFVIAKLYFESFLPRCRMFPPDFAFPVLASASQSPWWGAPAPQLTRPVSPVYISPCLSHLFSLSLLACSPSFSHFLIPFWICFICLLNVLCLWHKLPLVPETPHSHVLLHCLSQSHNLSLMVKSSSLASPPV